MKQGKIYIVEDDNTIVTLLKQHLSKVYDVFSVNNFRAIKQEIEEIKPDLILMDITLPYFNGFYWTTEIRKTMTLPIIFISSSDDEMDTVMALNMGGDDFISKPFSLTILDAKISAFLRRAYQFTFDNYQLDEFSLSREGILSNGSKQINLSPTENKILNRGPAFAGPVFLSGKRYSLPEPEHGKNPHYFDFFVKTEASILIPGAFCAIICIL